MEQVLKASIVRPVGLWTEGERWEEFIDTKADDDDDGDNYD